MKKVLLFLVVISLISCRNDDKNEIKSYLIEDDINIFLNSYEQIKHDLNNYGTDLSIGYHSTLFKLSSTKFTIDDLVNGNKILNYNEGEWYLKLINRKVPKKLNRIFKNVGWKNNGNKKYLTILNIYGFFSAINFANKINLKEISPVSYQNLKNVEKAFLMKI